MKFRKTGQQLQTNKYIFRFKGSDAVINQNIFGKLGTTKSKYISVSLPVEKIPVFPEMLAQTVIIFRFERASIEI